jgi:hypothetical protein
MASVNAAKKSPRNASRTTSSSASTARPKTSASNDAAEFVWTAAEQAMAAAQGWGVYECIDEKSHKIFFEMQSHGPRFVSDNEARAFIMNQNKAGDDLAIKAMRIVFRSKVGVAARSR